MTVLTELVVALEAAAAVLAQSPNRNHVAWGLHLAETTPQGRMGLSAYDPVAATAAAEWMLAQGRAREWDAVRYLGC